MTQGLNLTGAALQCQVESLQHISAHSTLSSTSGTNRPLETRYDHKSLGAENKSDA